MKKLLLFLLLALAFTLPSNAQESDFDKVYQACQLAQSSMEDGQGSQSELTEAYNLLKGASWESWTTKPKSGKEGNIKGHLVFVPEFLKELIVNKDVYKWAKRYAQQETVAEQRGDVVKMLTVCVRKESILTYELRATGTLDVACVAEINGLFNLTVTVVSADGKAKIYKEKSDEYKGASCRRLKGIKIGNGISKVTIEVENRGTNDKSVALIIK